jgi:hypothetical protein
VASTQLSDVIIPQIYDSYGFVPTPDTLAFLSSPAVRSDASLDEVANREGQITTMPFWNDLDASTDPNISTDNPATLATPQKVTAGAMTVRVADYNNAWSSADLVADIAGSDPMALVHARTSRYWSRQINRFLASMSLGVMRANVASNSGDMVSDIAVATNTTPAAGNLFSHGAVTAALFTNGVFFEEMSAIIVPATVYQNMINQDLITFVQPSNVNFRVPTYGGLTVAMPVPDALLSYVNGTSTKTEYVTVLCGPGVFGFGQGLPKTPSEVRREPLQGNGGGIEIFVERKRWVFHPNGHSFTSSSIAGQSPTSAEYGLAANWSRKVPRNSVPLAFLVTNG